METKAFIEHLQQPNMVFEIAKEFSVSKNVAIRRILIALFSFDFTKQILDPFKNY